MPRYAPTWVVLMDGSRGRILVQETRRARMVRAFGDGFSARMGTMERSCAPAGAGAAIALDRCRVAREQAEREFCGTVAGLLSHAAGDRRLSRLILVAPPRVLGDLRRRLSPQARALVHTEVARDWIDLPDREIEARLGAGL
ncbi:MAG TPA: host attachment protein [Nannocystis sp.]